MSSSRLRPRHRSRNFTLITPTNQTPQRDGAVPANFVRRNGSIAKPAGLRVSARARQHCSTGFGRWNLIVRPPVYLLDPLSDPRWLRLVLLHPSASISHSPEWLGALHRTYGYQPIAFTTSKPEEELQNGLVFCLVRSWLTGRRMVSLPFSDHCQPLVDSPEQLKALLTGLLAESQKEHCGQVEIRPVASLSTGPTDNLFFVAGGTPTANLAEAVRRRENSEAGLSLVTCHCPVPWASLLMTASRTFTPRLTRCWRVTAFRPRCFCPQLTLAMARAVSWAAIASPGIKSASSISRASISARTPSPLPSFRRIFPLP